MSQKADLILHNVQIALTVNQKSEVLKNVSMLIKDKKLQIKVKQGKNYHEIK
ncbi:MAG: hypothetical protein ACKOXS_00025 [Actinomycetes bacterium]